MSKESQTALLEIKDRIRAAEAGAKLAAALAKAQGEFKPVAKNRAVQIRMKEGGTYRFEYADLEQLISCTRPALAANGLAVVQRVDKDQLITELLHGDGGALRSISDLPRMGQDPKSYGAAITYLRRYAYSALLCLAADDDLDEDGRGVDDAKRDAGPDGSQRREEPQPRTKPAGEKRLASGAQLKWAKERLAVMETDSALALLAGHGIKSLDDELTVEAFDALKKDLLK